LRDGKTRAPRRPAWCLRRAETTDAEAIVNLLNDVYGDWGDLTRWQWKYHNPPAPFRFSSAVAETEGRIIGHYGIVPLEMVMEGRIVRGAQVVDAAVLPVYRRCGVFSDLLRRAVQDTVRAGAQLVYGFPGLLSLAANRRNGFRSVGFVPEMVKVLRPAGALATALKSVPGDLVALWNVQRQTDQRPDTIRRLVRLRRVLLFLVCLASGPAAMWPHLHPPPKGTGQRLVELARFDTRFDALWSQLQDNVALGLRKDARYLTWRYLCDRGERFRILAAERGKALVGFLIMRQSGGSSQIAELLAAPGQLDVVWGLLAMATEQARRENSLVITAWAPPGHPYHSILSQAGFVSPERLHRLARSRSYLGDRLYQVILYTQHLPSVQQAELCGRARQWSLAMGDSDLV